jgi:hypothetical protein
MTTERPPHRWHAYHTASAWGGVILLVLLAALPLPAVALTAVGGLLSLLALVTGLGALVAYRLDSKQDNGFTPIWWLWGLAHLGLGAPIIAPLYLLRRGLAVGGNSYEGTLFSAAASRLR